MSKAHLNKYLANALHVFSLSNHLAFTSLWNRHVEA